ncbi:unnamed protein product [Soboliphyme baturini]|uniref:Rho-related GTP-binding protein RhoU n=1 Tax=Soboliphyme baturini TaxID=241478 RepID=A0A183ISK0_9BILA|nr:unnamed protein product [Soboliphyme baturini]
MVALVGIHLLQVLEPIDPGPRSGRAVQRDEDFDAIRPLCYPGTTVFLLCFSVVCPASFANLQRRWLPEITQNCPKVPLILVGTQCDRRTNMTVLLDLSSRNESPVSQQEIKSMARKTNALQYIECSALTQKNLKEVFDAALMAALNITTGPVPPLHHFQNLRQKVTRALSLDSIHHSNLRVHKNTSSTHSVFNAKYSTRKLSVGHLITDGGSMEHDLQKKHKLRRGWRRMLCMS